MGNQGNYILRMIELITENFTDDQISEIIQKEYNTNLSPRLIARRRDPAYIKNFIDAKSKDFQKILNDILELLKYDNKSPKSTKEIAKLLFRIKGNRMTSTEIDKIIHNKLNDQVNFDEIQQKYYLQSSISKSQKGSENPFILDSVTINFEVSHILEVIRAFFKEKYVLVKSGNKKIDYLIKTIVKDNVITENEEIFLRQKAIELGISSSIIEDAKNSLNFNNPYLDNLIHIIYDDGIVTKEELNFLKEKSEEHNFTTDFVNRRFWSTGFSVFLSHLLNLNGFSDLIIVIYLSIELKFDKIKDDKWLFECLNIYLNDDLDVIINSSTRNIEDQLLRFIYKTKKIDGRQFIKKAKQNYNLDKQNIERIKLEDNSDSLISSFIKLLKYEKIRIGSPDANLLVENVIFRIENELWD